MDRPAGRSVFEWKWGAKNSNTVEGGGELVFRTRGSDKSVPRALDRRSPESPDTFRSRPESKKPFQLHLRTELAE